MTFDWITRDSPELAAKWPGLDAADDDEAVARLEDGTVLKRPTARVLAQALGLQTRRVRPNTTP